MTIQSIMVIDDDPLICELLVETLADTPYDVQTFGDPVDALKSFDREPADVVFTDLMMPEMSGLEVIERVHQAAPKTSIFLMTAYHSVEKAIEAIRLGAEDYLCKPFLPAQIEVLLAKAAERRRLLNENSYLRGEVCGCEDELVVGNDKQMLDLFERIRKVARSKASVMVVGETGTGKELVARALHRYSDRADKPFIKVNCAALAENLLESELFGHEKGAFTGADCRREGRFELADGGTILLDEVSEICPRLQAKLLRVLEEEQFERVGGSRTMQIEVRVISTTNRDIPVELREGRFREDLFYRLNVVPLVIPPLRDRKQDIPMLATHFLEMFARANGKDVPTLKPSVVRQLLAYHWPGNVRELKNLMHRAVVMDSRELSVPGTFCEVSLAQFGNATARRVGLAINEQPGKMARPMSGGQAPQASGTSSLVGRTIGDVEREMILETLSRTDGNKTAAAELLGVTPRTLRNKLSRYRSEGIPSHSEVSF